jgi:hypothetical protein
MKPGKILRTIESHLGIEPCYMPNIKENRKYLKDIGAAGAIIRIEGEKRPRILVENKKTLYLLAEELTHFIDTENSKKSPVKNYRDFFYNQALIEALGYYGSKILNPRRKPFYVRKRLEKNIAEKDWGALKNAPTVNYRLRTAWHEIGYDLGEKVYNFVKRTGNKEPALSLLIKNRNKEKPFEVYKKILEQVI